jgi:hypothetical protein
MAAVEVMMTWYCEKVSGEEEPVEVEAVKPMKVYVRVTLYDEQEVEGDLLCRFRSDLRGMVRVEVVARCLLLSVQVRARLLLVVMPLQGLSEEVLFRTQLLLMSENLRVLVVVRKMLGL